MSAGASGLPFDAYAVLGVSPSATSDEIHHAYRMLARRFHPDADRTDPGAAGRFAEITAAYDILVDVDRRRSYDLRRAAVARAPRCARRPRPDRERRRPRPRGPATGTEAHRRRSHPSLDTRTRTTSSVSSVFLAKVVIGVVIVIVLAACSSRSARLRRAVRTRPVNAPCTPTATPP